jgi:hypothetical protein
MVEAPFIGGREQFEVDLDGACPAFDLFEALFEVAACSFAIDGVRLTGAKTDKRDSDGKAKRDSGHERFSLGACSGGVAPIARAAISLGSSLSG